MRFLFQFLKNPKTVGAVLPSSHFLAEKMVEGIDFNKAQYIVEYGPGTGVFTDKLLKKRKRGTVILLVENNKEFCSMLTEKYKGHDNVYIVHGSAENIEQYIERFNIPSVDYVISGLPFSSLPESVSSTILLNTAKILKEEGQFTTFQYTKLKQAFIARFFSKIEIKRVYRNFPPAYIFSCRTNREESKHVKNTHCG